MEIALDPRKNIHANAAAYFEKAKQAREKRKRVLAVIEETKAKIAQARKEMEKEQAEKPAIVEKPPSRKREWFGKYHSFTTTGGLLCLAGKDARQNEELYSRHFQDGDLFLHADIQGAPFTLLKNGEAAAKEDKLEAAQWAASYSSAWKRGFTTVDVYAATHGQVSKRAESGEFVPKGGFIIRGAREWFKNTLLGIAIARDDAGEAVPIPSIKLENEETKNAAVTISPGSTSKPTAAKEIASRLKLEKGMWERVLQTLPGDCSIK